MNTSCTLFDNICSDLYQQGYSVQKNSLPDDLAQALYQRISTLESSQLKKAGIGRDNNYVQHDDIRRDKIHWIEGETTAEQQWLDWLQGLQSHINQRLYLGLFSYESHFAIYQPGDFYKKHMDAFQGESNRKLSVVTYLNPQWCAEYKGELVLFNTPEPPSSWHDSIEIKKILPEFSTTVIFLSEDFPHEVLCAEKTRFSIASWFQINQY